ncbi:MAG: DUF262 domain-containing protein [Campylobacter sp.]|nr:DUF262 domain-containing protein [Campylobacter sp.]
MENKTYYGEYTLKHWIDLILKQNIVLPEYQRSFVWTKEKIKFFINSLKNNEFIPPVAIGNYRNGENENLKGKNLILDGQQRLTSILLAYFKCFPIADKLDDNYVDENTDTDDDETANFKDWTFKEITGISKDKIKEKIKKYDEFDLKLDDKFFETHFLGFSYIVPNESNSDELFTKIFRNINYQGVSLSKQESRKSLYFIKSEFKNFFEGKIEDKFEEKIVDKDVLCDLKLQEHNKQVARIDFVRYLAILSHYHILGNSNNVMKGYNAFGKREDFYIDFISTIINIEQVENTSNFKDMKLKDTFGDICGDKWKEGYKTLRKILENIKPKILGKNNYFTSLIDADYYLFGLLYWVIFKNEKFENANFDELIKEIKSKIEKIKQDESYKRAPNLLGKIRERLAESIEIYGKYINE